MPHQLMRQAKSLILAVPFLLMLSACANTPMSDTSAHMGHHAGMSCARCAKMADGKGMACCPKMEAHAHEKEGCCGKDGGGEMRCDPVKTQSSPFDHK